MADTVDTDVMLDGPRHYVIRLRNVSDGTGESDVQKVDISTLAGPDGVNAPSSLSVEYIEYTVQGFEAVRLEWDHTTDEIIAVLSGEGYKDWRNVGGMHDSGSGGTGDILVSTVGTAAANDTYDITIGFKKKG